jgi:membrane protease YdiL (CAAX protease family)
LLYLVSHLVLIGMWQEFYYRGFVFNTMLKNNFGFHTSALISGIIFSMMHYRAFDLGQTSLLWFIGIVLIGYLIVFIYTYTNSIWSVVMFHTCWDFFIGLIDGKLNNIGLYSIKDYAVHEKLIDNLAVVTLGALLTVVLFLAREKIFADKIKMYVAQVTTAGDGG